MLTNNPLKTLSKTLLGGANNLAPTLAAKPKGSIFKKPILLTILGGLGYGGYWLYESTKSLDNLSFNKVTEKISSSSTELVKTATEKMDSMTKPAEPENFSTAALSSTNELSNSGKAAFHTEPSKPKKNFKSYKKSKIKKYAAKKRWHGKKFKKSHKYSKGKYKKSHGKSKFRKAKYKKAKGKRLYYAHKTAKHKKYKNIKKTKTQKLHAYGKKPTKKHGYAKRKTQKRYARR